MSDDRPEWTWKLLSMAPFGNVVAQIKEVPGPGRHFLVRRICGIKPNPEQPGSFLVHPNQLPVMSLADEAQPAVVYPHAIHWTRELRSGNVETMEAMFAEKKVALGNADDVKAEEQNQNRLRLLEGRNGG